MIKNRVNLHQKFITTITTMSWSNVLLVFIGSGFGGASRYLCSRWIQSLIPQALFPWGTFAVNVTGCFIIGMLYGLIDRHNVLSPAMRLMLTVGFCGGFTTFSTFINENFLLFSHSAQHVMIASGYMLASIVTGFAMLYAGYKLA